MARNPQGFSEYVLADFARGGEHPHGSRRIRQSLGGNALGISEYDGLK